MSKKLFFLLIFCCLLTLSACSLASNAPAPSKTPVVGNTITISNFTFTPSVLEIKANTTVTWINNDSPAHKVVSTNLFESPILNTGAQYQYTFTTSGTFDYFCQIHPTMKGQIIVK